MVNISSMMADLSIIALPLLAGLYSFWISSKKDGFDQEEAFDLVMYAILGGGLLSLVVLTAERRAVIPTLAGLNSLIFLFGFISTVCLVSIRWRWSVYRILDNFAVSFTLSAGFWLVMQTFLFVEFKPGYLLAAILLFIVYWLFQKYRLVVLKSGFTFCLVGGVFCLANILSRLALIDLIFVGLLFTLVVVVLIFRLRSLYARTKKSSSSAGAA